MTAPGIPLVSDADVRSVITVADALEAVEGAWADLGSARLSLSSPTITRLGGVPHGFSLKGALLDRYGVAGVRVTPTHTGGRNSWCLVLETDSGRPLVAVEESWLYRLRTAASAAVAARMLARPESGVLTVVGAGRIGRLMPAVFAEAFALREIRVVARRAESAAEFAAEAAGLGVQVTAGTDLDAAAPGTDILVAVTSSREPVVHGRHLLPGGTVLGLGGGAELAADVLTGAGRTADRLYVDDLDYAREVGSIGAWLADGMEPAVLRERLTGSLPDVAAGLLPGRTDPDETILGVVQGVAACDVALACVAMNRLGIS
ncbi:hypothetical protein [Streptomyces avicenniae]|uniref:hypothetical protein n=1 Tax=Streptomyces avicenniae TaxID=500153 RepID=UPI000699DF92|nr:hypothetical protein [Streptomyces avicenniae]